MRSFVTIACALAGAFVFFTTGCAADDKVLFKCTQTCAGSATALPDICESSDKSAEDIAKTGEQGVADAGVQGCTWSCQKTDTACNQAK